VAAAQRGTLAPCPGLGTPAATSALVFPAEIAPASPPSVQLGCVRDCLFLVTLDRESDGKPVLARRGALAGGASPETIVLPGPVPAGHVHASVRPYAEWYQGYVTPVP